MFALNWKHICTVGNTLTLVLVLCSATAQSQNISVVGQAKLLNPQTSDVAPSTVTISPLTVQLASSIAIGTSVSWTKISDPPQAITKTSSDASGRATLPGYIPNTTSGFKISACTPTSIGTSDPSNCAFFRFVGCGVPVGLGGTVSPIPITTNTTLPISIKFIENIVRVNGVAEPTEPLVGEGVNWTPQSGAGTVNPGSSTSDATGIATTQYAASATVGLQRVAATTTGPRTCGVILQNIDFIASAPANVAPAVSVLQPTISAITAPVSSTFITRVRASDSDGTIASVIATATNTSTGVIAWTQTVITPKLGTTDEYEFSWPNLPLGTYSIVAKATDNLGASTALPVTLLSAVNVPVNTAPSASIVQPATDVSVTVGTNLQVFLQATDTDGTIASLAVRAINTATGAVAWNDAKPVNPSLIGTDFNFVWPTLLVGQYSLTVTATDNGGAVSPVSPARIVTVTAANAPPIASIVLPDRDITAVEATNLTVRVLASDPDAANPSGPRGGISNVVARAVNTVSNVEVWTKTTSIESPGKLGNYDLVWTNLPTGRYSVTALAYDNLGTASPVTTARIVTVVAADSSTISIASPSAGQLFTADKDVAIVVRANPPTAGSVSAVTATVTRTGTTLIVATVPLTRRPSSNIYDGVWKSTVAGEYRVAVTASFNTGPARTDAVLITVAPPVIKAATLSVLNEASIAIKPKLPVVFDIVAKDAQGIAAPAQLLRWTLAIKPTTGATPDTPDSAAGGDIATDSSGTARIAFTAGSSVQDRAFNVFLIADPTINKSLVLKSPPAVAPPLQTISVVGKSIIAAPNQSQIVTVLAIDSNKLPIEGIAIDWFLEPANSGTLSVINDVTNAAGESKASFTLLPLSKGTLVKACPRGVGSSSDKCARFVVKNAVTELTQPAQAIVKPAATQSVAATRIQVGQVRTRFQQLRNEQSGGYRNDVGVTVEGGRIPLPSPDNSTSDSAERKVSGTTIKANRWGSFSVGDIDVSRATGDGGYEVSTQGLTLGVDYRLTPSVVIGAAFGGLRGKTTSDGTAEQRARGVSGSLFAQWFVPGEFYVNTVINHGRNAYDLRRFATPEIRIDSDAQSTQTALQLESGYNYTRDNLSVSPYVRVEHVRATIGGINEPVAFVDAIKTSASALRANTVALGLQGDMKFSTGNGVWIPGLRVEYLSEKQKQSTSTAELLNAVLVNGTRLISSIPVAPYDSSYGNAGLSLQWLTAIGTQPISVFFGFDTTFGKSGVSSKRFTAGLKVPL
jgi:outer membrane autotransporter protein